MKPPLPLSHPLLHLRKLSCRKMRGGFISLLPQRLNLIVLAATLCRHYRRSAAQLSCHPFRTIPAAHYNPIPPPEAERS
jgi:hypothetical protein